MYLQAKKAGQWETVKSKADDKKKRADDKKKEKETRDRLGVAVDPSTAAFAAFDKSFAARADAAKQQEAKKNYKGAFADLEDEAPPQQLQEEFADSGSDDAEPAASSTNSTAVKKAPKAPKAPKKPKLSVAQVAAGEWLQMPVHGCWVAVSSGWLVGCTRASLWLVQTKGTTVLRSPMCHLESITNKQGLLLHAQPAAACTCLCTTLTPL